MSERAPIAVFAYRRPEHLRRTLESLRRCAGFAESPVFVFCDGAKGDADAVDVAAARTVAQRLLGASAECHLSPSNRGLSRSILGGVAHVLERYQRIIVVEDDMDLSPGFLGYMNSALQRYEDEPRVLQVSGHMFTVPEFATRDRALLLPFTTSWGWATWRRAWAHFDADASGWPELVRNRQMRNRFNVGGACDYASMLEGQMNGIGDSWAIRWYWSAFRRGGLTLFPPVSMVRNTGMDGSGTHGRGLLLRLRPVPPALHPGPLRLPDEIEVDAADLAAVRRALWRHNGGLVGMLVDRARRLRRALAPQARAAR